MSGGYGDSVRFVDYNRPIFLISFLQEVFLRSVILFHSDFCFMRKDLRFRLRSFEFRRCGKFDKKNRRSLKICSGASCAVTPQDVHHPRRHENGQRLAGYVGKPETIQKRGSRKSLTVYSNRTSGPDNFRLARHPRAIPKSGQRRSRSRLLRMIGSKNQCSGDTQ